MSASTSRLSYTDCYELFDKALADPVGTRVRVKSSEASHHLRTRLQYARKIDREENKLTYNEGDPLYGRSAYDVITVGGRKEGNYWYVYLRKVDAITYEVESLNGITERANSDNGEVKREKETEGRRA